MKAITSELKEIRVKMRTKMKKKTDLGSQASGY